MLQSEMNNLHDLSTKLLVPLRQSVLYDDVMLRYWYYQT